MVKKLTLAIIDYEMGNIKSIENAINYIGDFHIIVTADKNEIINSDVIILPGVGAFPDAMRKLTDKGLVPILTECVKEQKKATSRYLPWNAVTV